MAADVSYKMRNREAGRGEIAICVSDIAAILLRISALLDAVTTQRPAYG
jgi:hypothetical protein